MSSESVQTEPDARCRFHPNRHAQIACQRCGDFACESCRSADDASLCDGCERRGRRELRVRQPGQAPASYAQASIAFAVVSMFANPLFMLSAFSVGAACVALFQLVLSTKRHAVKKRPLYIALALTGLGLSALTALGTLARYSGMLGR